MAEITSEKTHSLLEKLVNYVMNEVPNKKELEILLGEVQLEIVKRIQKVEEHLDQKASKEDIQIILNSLDAMLKNLDDILTEQKAFISGLRRLEKRVDTLEKTVG